MDQEPVSAVTDPTSWKSDDDANSQVAGCYSLIRSAFNAACSFYTYGDLPTDYWGDVANGDYKNMYSVNWAISVSYAATGDPKLKLRVWTPFYTSVQQSNRCIHYLQQMPDEAFAGDTRKEQQARRNKYLAEAKFCRAFNYFYMSRVWGDVPLDTTYQDDISAITSDPRVAQEKVLQAAISDLNDARKWLDYKDGIAADRAVRADKGAVFTLLAHIYAWKGAYDSCRMACDSVILHGGYALVNGASYPSIYSGQSAESIFEIAQSAPTEAMSTDADGSIAKFTLATPYLPNIATPNWQISANMLGQLFSDTTDKRYVSEFTYVNSGSNKFYYCTKYSNISTVLANNVTYYLSKNNIVVFRLADIYLLRAEANAAAAAPDYGAAVADINKVRSRAGVKEFQVADIAGRTALIDSVTAERGRELFLEGSRYYDLVRNERLTGVSKFLFITHAEFLKGKYYWPVDPSLMITNTGLKQTPYWQQLLTN
ncbi:outer membrane protein, nutrient binding [Filimonas lacunae]|nr:outer membrane protein, nutrient binding [Filimonas lacunae]